MDSFKELLIIERKVLNASGEAYDQGNTALMGDFITWQEKTVCMMKALVGSNCVTGIKLYRHNEYYFGP